MRSLRENQTTIARFEIRCLVSGSQGEIMPIALVRLPRVTWHRVVCLGLIFFNASAHGVRADADDLELILVDQIETQKVSPQSPKVSRPALIEYLPRPSANEQAILDKLDQPVEVVLRDNELPVAMNYLKELYGVEFWIRSIATTRRCYGFPGDFQRLSEVVPQSDARTARPLLSCRRRCAEGHPELDRRIETCHSHLSRRRPGRFAR